MSSFHLRALDATDLPLIRAWMRESHDAPAWSDAALAELIDTSSESRATARRLRRAWLAEDDAGAAVGFAVAVALRIIGMPAECELEFVLVPPAARRTGVGRALMQAVLLWSRQLPAAEVWLEVRTSNAQAIALYSLCGFIAVGRRPGYYNDPPEDAVLMRCRIDDLPANAPV